jgi:putative transcriptional regulator
MPIVKVNLADAKKAIEQFDWSELDAMTDEDIARQVAENPDAAPLLAEGADYSKWKRVRGRPSAARKAVTATITIAPGKRDVDLSALRNKLGMTQAEFARAYRFSVGAVRDLEQGRRKPAGPTAALLELIAADPDDVRRKLAGVKRG